MKWTLIIKHSALLWWFDKYEEVGVRQLKRISGDGRWKATGAHAGRAPLQRHEWQLWPWKLDNYRAEFRRCASAYHSIRFLRNYTSWDRLVYICNLASTLCERQVNWNIDLGLRYDAIRWPYNVFDKYNLNYMLIIRRWRVAYKQWPRSSLNRNVFTWQSS